MTAIISRQAWGAEHPDGFGAAPLPAAAVYLHHSVTGAPPVTASLELDVAAVRLLEQIGQARFRGGISYTFAVCPSGRVFQGHSVGRRGAHTKGLNGTARAIVLVGDYSKVAPGQRMLDAVADLLAHGHRAGWWTQPRLAGGHRDAPGAATACPGDGAWAVIPTINRLAAALDPTPQEDEMAWTRDQGAPPVPDYYRQGLQPLPDPLQALAWATAHAAHARDEARHAADVALRVEAKLDQLLAELQRP